MIIDLLLKDGYVISQGRPLIRSVGIAGKRIHGIYQRGQEPNARTIVNCENQYILPGMIDIHVHLRDLGQTAKEDYTSGTRAAAAGGVTTVVDMPNSKPPAIDNEVLQEKIARAKSQRIVNVGFYAGIPENPISFDSTMIPDILGIKVYPHSPLTKTRYNNTRIIECVKIARTHNIPLLIHPDLPSDQLSPKSMEDFMEQHDCNREVLAAQQFIDTARRVGGNLHICHISCASTAELVSSQREKIVVTGEATPHHLFLNRGMFDFADGTAKMLPPLREIEETKRLWSYLLRGQGVDTVGSDHAPHLKSEKQAPFLEALSGIPGLETTLPLLLTAIFKGKMPWSVFLRACCQRPAEIIGAIGKGYLRPGFDADIVVVAQEEYEIKGKQFFSKAKITPFEGWQVKARPIMTIVEGTLVYREREFIVEPGTIGTVPVRKHLPV